MYLKLNAVWLSGKGDTYRIWAVFVYVCIGRLSGCGLRGAVEGMLFRVKETRTRFGRFCVCVYRKVVGMCLTGCCGGDAVSGGGDTYRIWAFFVYVCVGRLSGYGIHGAVEGMRFRVEETRTGFGRFLCTCVSEGCRDVSYRVLWRGCAFGWRRHVHDLGGFCVRVYRKVVGMWLTGCCGGDAVSGKGDTYTIWAVLCMCVSEGCRDVSYRVLWRGCAFGWRRHVQDSGCFCVRVYRKVVGMCLTGCCGGDALSGGGDTYRIWAVFVYVCGGVNGFCVRVYGIGVVL